MTPTDMTPTDMTPTDMTPTDMTPTDMTPTGERSNLGEHRSPTRRFALTHTGKIQQSRGALLWRYGKSRWSRRVACRDAGLAEK